MKVVLVILFVVLMTLSLMYHGPKAMDCYENGGYYAKGYDFPDGYVCYGEDK